MKALRTLAVHALLLLHEIAVRALILVGVVSIVLYLNGYIAVAKG
jgi:hypothetical protein